MPFMFEKLEVYQRALDVAVKISDHTDNFPKGKYYLIDQINRAALSIPANLAEGNGRWHKNERKQFFWIARGSAQECVPMLEICKRKQLIQPEECEVLKEEIDIIAKMINGLIRGLEKE
jgi:four helix bundle protein